MATVERDIIVIGASAGGTKVIPELLAQLPADIPAAIFVVIHSESGMSEDYLPKLIRKAGFENCQTAKNEDLIAYGRAYVAPPDHHMLLQKDKVLVVRGPRENGFRPSIDMLFRSAAAAFDSHVLGVVLTGMLDDGTSGIKSIQRSGGLALVQDPEDATYPDMPLNAIKHNQINHKVPVADMGAAILKLITEPASAQPIPPDVALEASIAERMVTSIDATSLLGEQIPFSCPDCGGSLWQVPSNATNRYRCHTGHIFTEDGLFRVQAQALEETLWVSLRMLEERQHLLNKMVDQMSTSGRNQMAHRYEERLKDVQVHINRIRTILSSNEIYSGSNHG